MIRFSTPRIGTKAYAYLHESLEGAQLSGDGPFTARCHEWLRNQLGSLALLTHSCTAALEMSALLANVRLGDEVILPSYTFSSTANAFVLRGATPVFVDIRPDTLNLDETLLEAALTPRTKAIVPVHYAGVACEMDTILAFAKAHDLLVIEDAAQAHLSFYKGRALGTLGALGCLSFHLSKNLVSGEGGALIINDPRFLERAHILREKGTNRTAFFNGKVDKYEWLDVGSSYLPSDVLAALLLAQFEEAQDITQRRVAIWIRYHEGLAHLEARGFFARPQAPPGTAPNGHIYYLIFPSAELSRAFRRRMGERGILCVSHYVPLHSAPAGRRFGRVAGSMAVSERIADTIVRLPIHAELSDADADRVISEVAATVTDLAVTFQ